MLIVDAVCVVIVVTMVLSPEGNKIMVVIMSSKVLHCGSQSALGCRQDSLRVMRT